MFDQLRQEERKLGAPEEKPGEGGDAAFEMIEEDFADGTSRGAGADGPGRRGD